MELIYTDAERQPLGQLTSFDIDFDATGDKNFELTIDQAILGNGYWISIPGTEIGGIVDGVSVDTGTNAVVYKGRNLRGILNDRVINVPRGQTYVSAQGDIHDVINELLAEAQLGPFVCKEPLTVDVDSYVDFSFEPFCTLYDGIMALASSINFKLVFAYNAQTNKVEITPMLAEDFSDFLTYTKNSSVNLKLQENSMATNHFKLVGHSAGERYQIDLFIDGNAQVMDYATVLEPIKDSQYITDNRNQVFFGIEERCKVEETENISPIENYEAVTTKPLDWSENYAAYFTQKTEADGDDVNITYAAVEPKLVYKALNSQPSDWGDNYASYFHFINGEYQGVDSVSTTTDTYKRVKKKPKSWAKTYMNYFSYSSDGVGNSYNPINGLTKNYYKRQKYKPTDWANNYKKYYKVVKDGSKTKYQTIKGSSAPKWKKYKYFTKLSKTYAPKFGSNVYVKIKSITTESVPEFLPGETYRQYKTAPRFIGCYKKVLDHYGGMINSLLQDLEIFPTNEQTVSLDDFEADIGDVVGGYDAKTGITLTAPIVNIIYRIERGIQRSIEYEIGG